MVVNSSVLLLVCMSLIGCVIVALTVWAVGRDLRDRRAEDSDRPAFPVLRGGRIGRRSE